MSQSWKLLRNSFFAGLLVVLPVGASLGLLWWGVKLVTAWLPEQFSAPQHRMLAVVVLVVLTICVGWLARRVAGKRLIDVAEMLIRQVPLLNRIYPFMKEISDTVLSGKKTMFQRVVLVEFPRAGVYSIGFVTGATGGEAQAKINAPLLNVFVPTTPLPTSSAYRARPSKAPRTSASSTPWRWRCSGRPGSSGAVSAPTSRRWWWRVNRCRHRSPRWGRYRPGVAP